MRPALHRLLKRPSSLDLLRILLGTPSSIPTASNPRCFHVDIARGYTSTAIPVDDRPIRSRCADDLDMDRIFPELRYWSPDADRSPVLKTMPSFRLKRKVAKFDYGPWDESNWDREKMEFESNLEDLDPLRPKLLDDPIHRKDLRLWASLLAYQQRVHGLESARMFWRAVVRGTLELPTTGPYARTLWSTFLDLGFTDDEVLREISDYADRTIASTGKRWPALYITIIRNMLLSGRAAETRSWHHRLITNHPPKATCFIKLCREVCYKGGDMETLAYLYKGNNVVGVYPKVISTLCEREEFTLAHKWHFILLSKGDLPTCTKDVEPLVQFLAIYHPNMAQNITQSLAEAGVSFASTLTSARETNTKISREMINLVYGDVFQIRAKQYNDSLGARWFATRWISLDIAMDAINALGIQQIGPLSLQAIALRELDAESVTRRIDQLQDLGISIGDSKFSMAVEKFARSGNQEFLDGLIRSDQHPDELEDFDLQEKLLLSYARVQDWSQYRRTLAIRLIGTKDPGVQTENIILRGHAHMGDVSAILASLRKMQLSGIPVMPKTISRIVSGFLHHRQRGKRPVTSRIKGENNDLDLVISILRDIMQSGSFVPASYWVEIIKRLGMLGRFEELKNLCLFLASWYGPANQAESLDPVTKQEFHRYQISKAVPTHHPLHPLKILFGRMTQAAIVEWGFIQALKPHHPLHPRSGLVCNANTSAPRVTAGIELLKELYHYGVHIDKDRVRSAILNRLIIYYGPGRSNRLYNRADRARNPLSLHQMASQISDALGYTGIKEARRLEDAIYTIGRRRLIRRAQTQNRPEYMVSRGRRRDPRLLKIPPQLTIVPEIKGETTHHPIGNYHARSTAMIGD